MPGRANSINKGSEAESCWPETLKFLLAGVVEGAGECAWVEREYWMERSLEGIWRPRTRGQQLLILSSSWWGTW